MIKREKESIKKKKKKKKEPIKSVNEKFYQVLQAKSF